MIPQLKPLTDAIKGLEEKYNNMLQQDELTAARRELAQIFKYECEALCEEDSKPSIQALRLLLAYPQLAKEWFEGDPEVPFRFSPLSIFVASGAGLRAVEAVDQLYKPAVATKHPELQFYVSVLQTGVLCWPVSLSLLTLLPSSSSCSLCMPPVKYTQMATSLST
jgi:hypothetical protein